MPLFSYRAKSFTGEIRSGQIEVPDKTTLAQELHKDGYVLTFAEELAPKTSRLALFAVSFDFLQRISLADKMMFCRNLAILAGAGVSLNRALDILAQETEKQKFKRIIRTVSDEVRAGRAFSESLEKFPRVFDDLFTNMVRVGETGGNLEEVLQLLAAHYEKEHELRGRVIGALVYPLVIVCVMIIIGFVMMIFVIPKLTKIFEDLNAELPFTTQLVITASKIMAAYAPLVLGGLALGIWPLWRLARSIPGQKVLHKLFLTLPISKHLSQKVNSARMSRILSSLIEAGVPMVRSLEIASRTLGNYYFRTSLVAASQDVQKGKPLSQTLSAHSGVYPVLLTQMIQVGEESGKLAEILLKIADFYEAEVSSATRNLSSVIEPLLMVVIGGAVGLFAVSMIQPLYSLVSQAG